MQVKACPLVKSSLTTGTLGNRSVFAPRDRWALIDCGVSATINSLSVMHHAGAIGTGSLKMKLRK